MLIVPDSRIDRWLGAAQAENIATHAGDFYAPLKVAGVPGRCRYYRGAWFAEHDHFGQESSLAQLTRDTWQADYQRTIYAAGFSSWSDLVTEATTNNKYYECLCTKIGSLAVVSSFESLWGVGSMPATGAQPADLSSAGNTCSLSTTGAVSDFPTGKSPDKHFFVSADVSGTAAPNSILVYDRLWHGRPGVAATTDQTITNFSISRYNGATSSVGNFGFIEVQTVLPNTAHGWTFNYRDQDNNVAETTATATGYNSAAVTRVDHPQWFIPLNGGDRGIRELTAVTLKTNTLASGAVNLVLGHALTILPADLVNTPRIKSFLLEHFDPVELTDSMCISFMGWKGVATATNYTIRLTTAWG